MAYVPSSIFTLPNTSTHDLPHSILARTPLYLVSIAQSQRRLRQDNLDAMHQNDYVRFLRDADFKKTMGRV